MAANTLSDLKHKAKARIAALESELAELRSFAGGVVPRRKVSRKSYLAMVANAARARAAKAAKESAVDAPKRVMSAEIRAKISAARRKQIARDRKR